MILRPILQPILRPVLSKVGQIVHRFFPSRLFASGEQGAWYDPSDRATLFQDSAGTTPVTAVEQPVGLILDKSKGLVRGVDIFTMKSPAAYFNLGQVDAGWITGTGFKSLDFVAVSPNSAYEVTPIGGSADRLRVQFEISGSTYVVDAAQSLDIFSWSTSRIIRTPANATKMRLYFGTASATATGLTVKELPGNHAFQTTTTSRPVLSARYNLLTKTEDFSDVYWTKLRSAVTEKTRVTATESNANGFSVNRGGLTIPAAAPLQAVIRFERGSQDWAAVTVFDGSANGIRQFVNTATGQLGTLVVFGSGWSRGTASASVDGADVVLTVTVNTVGTNAAVVIYPATSGDGALSCVLGDYGFIKQADLRLSIDSALPYQRVNTATDYDADPAKFPVYLRFDGVDDWLQTNSIDFTSTDKMTVFAGVRKLSDGGDGTLVELSVAADTNNGAFFLRASAGAFPNYQFLNRGTINASTTGVGFAAPTTNTLTTLADISGDSAILRVNGTQVASSTANQGTGNYGNYPLYIGRRGGTSLPFNGQIYSLIVRGAQTSTTQIAQTETWVNGKTKAY